MSDKSGQQINKLKGVHCACASRHCDRRDYHNKTVEMSKTDNEDSSRGEGDEDIN